VEATGEAVVAWRRRLLERLGTESVWTVDLLFALQASGA
jgi:hypothetical protein